MYNEKNDQFNQNSDLQEIYTAKLALLGAALSTLGDGIQTIAAGLALQQLASANKQASQENEKNVKRYRTYAKTNQFVK